MEPGVTVKYFGHACFLVTDAVGKSIAIDPFDARVGYPVPKLSANVCLVTHGHFDHSNTAAVSGNPQIVKTAGQIEARGIPIVGVTAPHHAPGKNAERGDVVMFRWTMDGMNLAHLGDLGAPLTPEQVQALSPADVLMVPVGGFFTIDAAQAAQVVQALKARIVLPMHYKTAATLDLPIAPVAHFLAAVPTDWAVTGTDENSITITQAELEKPGTPTRVVVLNYK